jgi:GNAT superfamily N-acetyltransferase
MIEDPFKNQESATIKIEIATAKDWERYKDIRLEALTVNPEAFGSTLESTSKRTTEEWQLSLSRKDVFMVLASINESLKGAKSIAGARITEDGWLLIAVYTRPDSRGQGLSEKVLNTVLEEVKRRGGDKVSLYVTRKPEQESARKLYKKIGFSEVEEKDKDNIFMVKDLKAK